MLRRTNFVFKNLFARQYTRKNIEMSTVTLPGTEVSIKLVDDLTKEQLLEFPAFKVPLPSQPYPLRSYALAIILYTNMKTNTNDIIELD
jgi:hypothetical protein